MVCTTGVKNSIANLEREREQTVGNVGGGRREINRDESEIRGKGDRGDWDHALNCDRVLLGLLFEGREAETPP